jgi:hypothetical protein
VKLLLAVTCGIDTVRPRGTQIAALGRVAIRIDVTGLTTDVLRFVTEQLELRGKVRVHSLGTVVG